MRERLASQRTGIINQIRAFMLERGIAVRQGIGFLRTELPTILATRTDALSPRMLRVIEELAGDWRRLDQRIDGLSGEIEVSNRFQPRPPFACKDDPAAVCECFASDGAETGGAEPHIAEQSRSWRAASGEQEVMRGF